MLTTLTSLLLLCAAFNVNGCQIAGLSGSLASKTDKTTAPNAYTLPQALEVLQGWGGFTGQWVNNTKVSFGCVDSRGTTAGNGAKDLESPGGDFAELAAGIAAYSNVTGTPVTEQKVAAIFQKFMNTVASAARPFYFHTSRDKMEKAFKHVAELVGGPAPVVLPVRQPTDANLAAAWYESLVLTDAQGCGHVRYMMQQPEAYGMYGAKANIPKWLLTAFFKYWWPTPKGSYQRSKIDFPILLGPLDGRAVAIINNKGPACPGQSPAAVPSHGGSAMFLFNAEAAGDFRSKVLGPFFKSYDSGLDEPAFVAALDRLQGKHLGATLKLLSPVNTLPIYSIDVAVLDDVGQRSMQGQKPKRG